MTYSSDPKWIQAISKLNAMTQTGKLRWEVEGALSQAGLLNSGRYSFNAPSQGGTAYRANYQDKWFRLSSSSFSGAISAVIGGGQYTLEITDHSGNTLFVVPEHTGLNDLYKSVQFQLAGVDTLLNSILSER